MADLTTIKLIHARLFARYGSTWRSKYAGLDPETVEKDWLHELSYCSSHAINYALDNIPADFPPTAGQFRELCRRAPAQPESEPKRLNAPKPDPARLKAAFERMREITKGRSPTAWIDDLEARRAGGERLSMFQEQCLANARENLSHRPEDVTITTEDSRRTDELKRAASARVEAYLRDHPELRP